MAWFVPPYNWLTDLAQGIGIRADRHTAQDTSFTNGISAGWCVDPTVNGAQFVPNVPTVNPNLGGFRITNAADGIGAQDLATVSQLTGATNSPVWGGVFTGTANAVVITLSPPLLAYGTGGIYIEGIVGNTNTGNLTVNVNGLGAIPVLKNGTQQLEPGDWKVGQAVQIVYDGANFHNLSPVNGLVSQTGTAIFASGLGTANAITVTLNPAPGFTAYPNGFTVGFYATNTNTGPTTLSVNGMPAAILFDSNGQILSYGDITLGKVYFATYSINNVGFVLTSPTSTSLNRSGKSVYAADTGVADALAVVFNPPLTNAALKAGTTLYVLALNANTGATTISLSGGAAINIVKLSGAALVANDILAGQLIELTYMDAGTFQLMSPLGNNVTNIATAGLATGGPITSTGTITVPQTTAAIQRAGASNANAVTPQFQQFHQSAVKAWASFTWNGAAIVINSAYNVSPGGIVRNAAGSYTVTMTNAMLNINYGINVTILDTAVTVGNINSVVPPTTTAFTIYTFVSNTGMYTDPNAVYFEVIGNM